MSDSGQSGESAGPRTLRAPIRRALDEYSPDPDHVRGAKYANLLLGEELGKGDVVEVIPLARVEPEFFAAVEAERGLAPETDPLYGEFKRDPDLISLPSRDSLPEEFVVADGTGGGQ